MEQPKIVPSYSNLPMLKHLLACLSEECGEVIQECGKGVRFGLLDCAPNTSKHNWVKLRKEVHDIIAAYEMLCDTFDRVETLDRSLIEKKKAKMLKWIGYADSKGMI